MAYATLDDLKAKLGGKYAQLTDRAGGTSATADDGVGQQILDAACSEFDGWVGGRYQTPVDTSVDPARAERIKKSVLILAAKAAWEDSPARMAMPPIIRQAYDDEMVWLKAVAAGTAALPGPAVIPSATSEGPSAVAAGRPLVFGHD